MLQVFFQLLIFRCILLTYSWFWASLRIWLWYLTLAFFSAGVESFDIRFGEISVHFERFSGLYISGSSGVIPMSSFIHLIMPAVYLMMFYSSQCAGSSRFVFSFGDNWMLHFLLPPCRRCHMTEGYQGTYTWSMCMLSILFPNCFHSISPN